MVKILKIEELVNKSIDNKTLNESRIEDNVEYKGHTIHIEMSS